MAPHTQQKENTMIRQLLTQTTLAMLLLLAFVQPALSAQDFLLFYSNDVHGETEPCG